MSPPWPGSKRGRIGPYAPLAVRPGPRRLLLAIALAASAPGAASSYLLGEPLERIATRSPAACAARLRRIGTATRLPHVHRGKPVLRADAGPGRVSLIHEQQVGGHLSLDYACDGRMLEVREASVLYTMPPPSPDVAVTTPKS